MLKTPIYMDYQATTPVDPLVLQTMMPFFTEHFGNPSSRQHRFGWIADEAVSAARETVAHALRAETSEIIFTSGATESNNMAIKGLIAASPTGEKHIITVATEHKSVIDVCKLLAKSGVDVTILPVDQFGLVDPEQIRKAIRQRTVLVSVMIANNEIGTIQPIAEIGKICREKNVLFHTDATQAVGKIPVDVNALGVDLLSLSGHKIYGPKGVGLLYIRNRTARGRLKPLLDGGGHERGLRSGSVNVAGVVGLAKALEISVDAMTEESARLRLLRDRLWNLLSQDLDETFLNGHPTERIPNNLNVSFLHVEDTALMMSMKDVAVASGSACSSADPAPSHVLRALGIGGVRQNSAIRFGLGRWTTQEEVDYVAGRTIETVKKLRTLSPTYRPGRKKAVAHS